MGNGPDEAWAERGNDEDTPDRPFTMADHVDALLGLPSVQSTGRAVKEHDPRVQSLDCLERLFVTPSERPPDASRVCEPVGGATRVT
jgi:hypothetical protein